MNLNSNSYILAASFAGMAFFGMAFVVMGAVLPSLSAKFSLDTAAASTLTGLLPLGIMLGALLFGPIIDRFGYKALIIISSLIVVAGLEMLAYFGNLQLIRLSIFILGFGGGLLNGLSNALTSDASNDHNRSSNLSILGIFYCLGAISIPTVFAYLSKSITYNYIVSGAGAIMALSVIFYAFVTFPAAKAKAGIPRQKILKMFTEPTLLLMSFTLFFQSGMEGITSSWIPSFMENVHSIDKENAMMALSISVIGIGVGRVFLSYILKHQSANKVLLFSMIIAIIGTSMITYFSDATLSLAGAFLMGLGYSSSFPVILGIIGEKYKEMSGTAFSFALTIALFGNTLINLAVGASGLQMFPYIVMICIVAITILFSANAILTNKNRKQSL